MNPKPYIDDDLSALADSARRFAEERVKPGFLERDRSRVLDRTLMREMGELGFIGPELPEAFGGLGLGCLAAGVICEATTQIGLMASGLGVALLPAPLECVRLPRVRYLAVSDAGAFLSLAVAHADRPPSP